MLPTMCQCLTYLGLYFHNAFPSKMMHYSRTFPFLANYMTSFRLSRCLFANICWTNTFSVHVCYIECFKLYCKSDRFIRSVLPFSTKGDCLELFNVYEIFPLHLVHYEPFLVKEAWKIEQFFFSQNCFVYINKSLLFCCEHQLLSSRILSTIAASVLFSVRCSMRLTVCSQCMAAYQSAQ